MKKIPQLLSIGFADFAKSYGGFISINGGFSSIIAESLPYTHSTCSLAVKLLFDRDGIGFHNVIARTVDPAGKPIFRTPEMIFKFDLKEEDSDLISYTILINFKDMPLSVKGIHKVNLSCDGEAIGSIPFEVKIKNKEA